MGKIHDALERAEIERTRGGAPGGTESISHLLDRPVAPPRGRLRFGSRRRVLRDARKARLVLSDSGSPIAEQYRSLRARIQSLRRGRTIRSIVVTIAVPREGKTTTAVNLALCFGLELEHSACLLDGDLRTPAVHRALSKPAAAGIVEVLEGHASLDEALLEVPETRLWALPVHSLPGHPAELLASRRMAVLMEELHARFDTIVVDSPPVLALPDATTLVDLCDAAILVVQSGAASREDVARTLERIDRMKLLGTVLNRAEQPQGTYPYYAGGGG
jgi:receptor protein-tyrosine kinase